MLRVPLVPASFLDPRPADDAARTPIADAVNISLAELPARVHELPPRSEVVQVVGPDALAETVVEWLRAHGRQARVPPEYRLLGPHELACLRRLWRPAEFLEEILPNLGPGAALDVACGTGRDAVFMAASGWDVTAVDVLPDALARGRELSLRYSQALLPIWWVPADWTRTAPVFWRQFDLIIGFRYLHRPLFAALRDWLAPGGSLVYESFTTIHRERHGRPTRSSHVFWPGELRELLAAFELRHYSEGWRGAAHTARAWAVRT